MGVKFNKLEFLKLSHMLNADLLIFVFKEKGALSAAAVVKILLPSVRHHLTTFGAAKLQSTLGADNPCYAAGYYCVKILNIALVINHHRSQFVDKVCCTTYIL